MKENPLCDQVWSQVWDVEKVSDALDANVEPHIDVLTVRGLRLQLNRTLAELDLFPENHALALRRSYFALHLSNVQKVEASKERIRIEAGDASTQATVFFQPTGEIVFNVSPKPPQLTNDAQQAPKELATTTTTTTTAATEEPVPPRNGSIEEQATIETEQNEKERVFRFTGRIGKLVETKTPTGKLKLIVPLGVKSGEDTIWHRIAFWEDKAEQVLKNRKTGEMVTVVFYEHPPREVVTKTGVRKLVPDLRGAAIYTPKEKK